jgi:hypothetical protein
MKQYSVRGIALEEVKLSFRTEWRKPSKEKINKNEF